MKSGHIIIILLIVTACKQKEELNQYSISGLVLEVITQKPIADAIINVYLNEYPSHELLARAASDSNGLYSMNFNASKGRYLAIELTEIGSYQLYQISQGGEFYNQITLADKQKIESLNLILVPPAYVQLKFTDSFKLGEFDYVKVIANNSQKVIETESLDSSLNFQVFGNIQDSISIYKIESSEDTKGNLIENVVSDTMFHFTIEAFDTLCIES
jgi:hypothetical protein